MIIIIHTLCGRGKKTWEQLQEEGEGEKAANVQVSFCTGASFLAYFCSPFMTIYERLW